MELDDNQMCGFIVDMDYREATIITDDSFIEDVGGIEQGAFLVAESDSGEYILLRTIEPAPLIDESARTQVKNDTFSNELTLESDEDMEVTGIDEIDPYTKSNIQKQGYLCSVLGTFYETENELEFGGDIQTVLSGAKYKVYKPKGASLEKIVNYNINETPVKVGNLSYTETKFRDESGEFEVPAKIDLDDFKGAKTAFFGMTRTGKSNSIKVLASALHKKQLETNTDSNFDSFGQLIVDASGEYANPNEQDEISIARLPETVVYTNRTLWEESDTYQPIIDNLYKKENREQLVNLILGLLYEEDSDYVESFKSAVKSINLDEEDIPPGEFVSNNRQLSLLYAILAKCELESGDGIDFARDFEIVHNSTIRPDFEDTDADTPFFGPGRDSSVVETDWDSKINEGNQYRYISFNSTQEQLRFWKDVNAYLTEEEIDDDDAPLSEGTLDMLEFLESDHSGTKKLTELKHHHNSGSQESMIDNLYSHLEDGKLVILDMSAGNEQIITQRANASISRVYDESKRRFRDGEELPPIQIYLEEAHRYFDTQSFEEDDNIYVDMAKEGAKMDIGLSYATQEVSSIDDRVLSNTANWFVTHINNDSELTNLTEFYDFDTFATSIRRVDQQGFSKLLTKSHRYAVPIRMSEFTIEYIKQIGFKEHQLSAELSETINN